MKYIYYPIVPLTVLITFLIFREIYESLREAWPPPRWAMIFILILIIGIYVPIAQVIERYFIDSILSK